MNDECIARYRNRMASISAGNTPSLSRASKPGFEFACPHTGLASLNLVTCPQMFMFDCVRCSGRRNARNLALLNNRTCTQDEAHAFVKCCRDPTVPGQRMRESNEAKLERILRGATDWVPSSGRKRIDELDHGPLFNLLVARGAQIESFRVLQPRIICGRSCWCVSA